MAAIQTATQQSGKRSQCAQTWAVQACELFLLQRASEGFCREVQILVLCYVTLAWAQVHLKMRRNAKGHKAISEIKAGEGIVTLKVTDCEQERRRHRPTGRNESRREQKSTIERLSWITTELGCGSNSGRAASSCLAGSASGLTCTQVNTLLCSSSWSEGGVAAVAWFQVQG